MQGSGRRRDSSFSLEKWWVAAALAGCCWAQSDLAGKGTTPDRAGHERRPAVVQRKLTPSQQEGLRLLKAAELEAGALEPAMAAKVKLRLSDAYRSLDPGRADKLEEEAFTATEAIEDGSVREDCDAADVKSSIQDQILEDLVKRNQMEEAERLVRRATSSVRDQIIGEFVQHYAAKNFTRAQAWLHQLEDSDRYPFGAAADLLLSLGREHELERLTIFNQALGTFEQHGMDRLDGGPDISTFIAATWESVPPDIVLEAIGKALEGARTKSRDSHVRLTMASEDWTVTLDSLYQLRVFQFLPILQELDPQQAETLLQENMNLKSQLTRYPKAWFPFSGESSVRMVNFTDTRSGPVSIGVDIELSRRLDDLENEAEKDPAQALSDALTVPLSDGHGTSPRADALLEVAQIAAKTKPRTARSTLEELWRIEDQWASKQLNLLARLPWVYLELGDRAGARKALSTALKAADQLYAQDTDANDPNRAFKGNWPSVELWRASVEVAAKLSVSIAQEIIASIPDPEIATLERLDLGSSLVGAAALRPVVSCCHKNEPAVQAAFSDSRSP